MVGSRCLIALSAISLRRATTTPSEAPIMPREPSAAAEAIAGDAIRILYRRCIADVRRLYRLYRGPLEREGKWEGVSLQRVDELVGVMRATPPRLQCCMAPLGRLLKRESLRLRLPLRLTVSALHL